MRGYHNSWIGIILLLLFFPSLDAFLGRPRFVVVGLLSATKRDQSWQERFLELKEEHHRDDNPRLTRWVSRQRQAYRQGTLRRDRIAQLDSIPGFEWETVGVFEQASS